MNYLARKKSSLCLSARIGLLLPRVETYRQPADDISREVHLRETGEGPEVGGHPPVGWHC